MSEKPSLEGFLKFMAEEAVKNKKQRKEQSNEVLKKIEDVLRGTEWQSEKFILAGISDKEEHIFAIVSEEISKAEMVGLIEMYRKSLYE